MRELRPSVLAGLAPSAAALVVGMVLGSAAPASAQNAAVLHACVRVDRQGDLHGRLRVVEPGQRCGGGEAHIILPLAGTGGIPGPAGPARQAGRPGSRRTPGSCAAPRGPRRVTGSPGPSGADRAHGPKGPARPAPPVLPAPGAAAGGAYEGGGIKGILKECGLALAPSMVYLNGHSFIAFIGGDAADTVTGSFELHHVPPGTYDLVLVTPNLSDILPAFRWSRGRSPTWPRGASASGLIPSRSCAGAQPVGRPPAIGP